MTPPSPRHPTPRRSTPRRSTPSRPTPRAFTLLELLVAIGVIITFLAVAGWCTYAALRIYREVPNTQNAAARSARLFERLRTDVFSADTVTLASPSDLTLTRGQSRTRWTLSPAGTLTRAETPAAGTPATLAFFDAPDAAFDYTAPVLTLRSSRGTLTAVAELARLKGAHP